MIRIGTRKSPLALAQAEEVKAALLEAHPQLEVSLVPMMTSGDTFTDIPLTDVGGKGLFTKEIEEALLANAIDIAVHSMKDMQTMLPDGLTIGCMLEREDPRDVLIGAYRTIADLPKGTTFGTSSLRRSAQLLMLRPDMQIVPLRGNVQTRLAKITEGAMQATMLAKAGISRLRLADVPGTVLNTDEFLPAVGQGAIGIECREGDETLELLSALSHVETETAVLCERAFLAELDGSCRTPIAGHAVVESDKVAIEGLIMRPDGSEHHRIRLTSGASDALSLGEEAGKALLAKAGRNFLA